ncbi:MAG: hypothetical protein KDD67_14250 [Ignavibacteriae bacterium]|nr:hypothetical protein [Ignavibacteriota bacterium]
MNTTSRIYRSLRFLTGSFRRSVLFLLFLSTLGVATARQTTNIEQFQRCAMVVVDTLFARTISSDEFCVRVVSHPADWIVDQGAIDLATARGVSLVPCRAPYTNELLIAITDIGVRYVELDDEDFYRREVRLSVSASIPVANKVGDIGGGNPSRTTERVDYMLNDTIEAASISEIESPGYNFTTGTTIRINRSSFWKSVAEPAIIVGTSVVMVILLFTTRSQ